jgi:outer membrane lipoprotein-sorting protein
MEAAEVSSLLDELRRQAESVRRYQGLVGVRGRGPEGGFDARLAVFFERPDKLRVELLGAFGGTRWSAVASGEEITAYFPGRRHYLREPDVADVVARLLGLRLGSEDMMAALSGVGVPVDPSSPVAGYRRGVVRFLEIATPSKRILELDGAGQVVSAQSESYRVSYPGSWKSRGRTFPGELTIENESLRARLETKEVDVNVQLDPETFLLEVPADAERLRPAEIDGEAVFVVGREPR